MKRRIIMFVLCFALLCVPCLKVQAESSGDWTYQIRNGNAYITHYHGAAGGHVEIPSSIDGYTVTGIGNSAFLGKKITSVTIPDTMTEIGDATFAHCPDLVTVRIPKNVSIISGSAFMDCASLTGFTVDLQNKHFAHDAKGVLYTKDNLNLLQVPGAMEGKFVVPKGVMYIAFAAFRGCGNLTEIVIADTVSSIGGYAFCDCTGLTRLQLPASVSYIGYDAFSGCDNLTGIDVAKDNQYFSSDASGALYNKDKSQIIYAPGVFTGHYVVPEGTKEIGPGFFEGCDGLISVTITEGVTEIGHYAFAGCDNLEQVTIAESVCRIGSYSFEGCPKLTTVNIPEQVTHIEWGTFRGCQSLTQLPIHDKVQIIDDYAFAECNGLTDIVIPASVEKVGHLTFHDCRELDNIYFCGDAPEFVMTGSLNGPFSRTEATAYYHKGTEGWTEENKSKSGGSITWVELEHIILDDDQDYCLVCGELTQSGTPVDPEEPEDDTNVPGLPEEENPETADRSTDIASIVLLLAAGFVLLKTRSQGKELS